MRYSADQGSADSVPAWYPPSSPTQSVFAAFRFFRPVTQRMSRCLILLRTLCRSLRCFARSFRLFSTTCSLFLQNTGGCGVPLRQLSVLCASSPCLPRSSRGASKGALFFASVFVAPLRRAASRPHSTLLSPISVPSIYL